MPGTVAAVLEMPNSVPAYGGAMSPWLMKKPAKWKPHSPTASVRQTMAATGCVHSMKPVPTRKEAGPTMPAENRRAVCGRTESPVIGQTNSRVQLTEVSTSERRTH